MSDCRIEIIDSPPDTAAYTAYVSEHPAATLFHTLQYRDFLAAFIAAEFVYVVARRNGVVAGVLPLAVRDGPFGKVLNSLPFFGSYGGVLADDAEAARSLLAWLDDFVASEHVVASTLVQNPFAYEERDVFPTGGTHHDQRIAQWTVLPPLSPASNSTAGTIMSLIDSSARRNIRKAQEQSVVVRRNNEEFDFLRSSHLANMAEIGGLAKPTGFFSAVRSALRSDQDYRLYVAYEGATPVGSLLVFLFREYAEYIMPTTAPGLRHLQPTALILHEAMSDAQAEGRTIWNWGGTWTSQTGVYRFKKKWGAREQMYRYSINIHDPSILGRTQKELMESYANFYVAPYSALTSG